MKVMLAKQRQKNNQKNMSTWPITQAKLEKSTEIYSSKMKIYVCAGIFPPFTTTNENLRMQM